MKLDSLSLYYYINDNTNTCKYLMWILCEEELKEYFKAKS